MSKHSASEQLTALCESLEKYRSTGLMLDRRATNEILDMLQNAAFDAFGTEDELAVQQSNVETLRRSKLLLETTLTRVRARLADYELHAQPPGKGQLIGNIIRAHWTGPQGEPA